MGTREGAEPTMKQFIIYELTQNIMRQLFCSR